MSTRFTRIAALALPLLLVAACASDEADDAAIDTDLPAVTDTGMYVPPPPPPMDTGTMGMDTLGADTTGMDTTGTN